MRETKDMGYKKKNRSPSLQEILKGDGKGGAQCRWKGDARAPQNWDLRAENWQPDSYAPLPKRNALKLCAN